MIEGFFNCSIMKRAHNKVVAKKQIHNLLDNTEDKYLEGCRSCPLICNFSYQLFSGSFSKMRSAGSKIDNIIPRP